MPTLATTLRTFAAVLVPAYGPAEARALARRVIGHRLTLAPHELVLRSAEDVPPAVEQQLTTDQHRLLAHEPVQYVLGTAPFLDLDLEVGPGVLIPRPETEELVQYIIRRETSATGAARRILDVGTGSGCIAVALAHYLPGAAVVGLDVSEAALTIARRNGARHGDSVQWLTADLFQETVGPADFGGLLDVLVSNPPYVPQREAAALAPHVRDFEPALALFVPDAAPLRYYQRLAAVGRRWLRPGGRLYLETHTDYAAAVADLLQQAGYHAARPHDDFTARPRFVTAEWPGETTE